MRSQNITIIHYSKSVSDRFHVISNVTIFNRLTSLLFENSMIQQNCYNKPGGFKYSSQDPKITFLSLSVHRNIPERRISIFTCKLMAPNISRPRATRGVEIGGCFALVAGG